MADSPALCASKQERRTASASAARVCASILRAWHKQFSAQKVLGTFTVGPCAACPQQLEVSNHALRKFMQKCFGVNCLLLRTGKLMFFRACDCCLAGLGGTPTFRAPLFGQPSWRRYKTLEGFRPTGNQPLFDGAHLVY